jgi:hypothetical protein
MAGTRLAIPILVSLFLMVAPVGFVAGQAENKTAKKFDEFGDIQISDLKARLDNYAIQLQAEPHSKGFLLVYRSRRDLPGLSYRYAERMEDYLINSRGLEKERVVAVDGGEANCLWQELWIVPLGAAPIPRSDAYQRNFVDTESARKFDEFTWGYDDVAPGVYSGQLEAYVTSLQAEPRARAYLIAYTGYYINHGSFKEDGKLIRYSDTYQDPPGTAKRVLAEARRLLTKTFHFSPSRIRFMDGGSRKQGGLELWIVPRGEHAPIPTPNSFPRRRATQRK